METLLYFLQLIGWFFAWTLYIYWLHRIAHIKSKWNPLWKIHLAHHKVKYLDNPKVKWPHWTNYFLWFGNLKSSLDIWVTLTLPLIALTFFGKEFSIPLLVIHYLYEVFLSESVLDHNPKIRGGVTKYFAWGKYHLLHHRKYNYNFGLMITLWDHVFKTVGKEKVLD